MSELTLRCPFLPDFTLTRGVCDALLLHIEVDQDALTWALALDIGEIEAEIMVAVVKRKLEDGGKWTVDNRGAFTFYRLLCDSPFYTQDLSDWMYDCEKGEKAFTGREFEFDFQYEVFH